MNHPLPTRFQRWLRSPWCFLALSLLMISCSTPRYGEGTQLGAMTPDNAAAYMTQAKQELAEGDLIQAVVILIELRKTRGLVPEQLYEADRMLNDSAEKLFAQTQKKGATSSSLHELYKLELPTRLRATAGLREAQLLFEEGHPVLCYRQVADVERQLPNHPMRDLAAETLSQTGTYMLDKGGSYNLFFSYRVKGSAALEFLVERYTSSPLCPSSYAQLASYYESIDENDLAIERWEDLLIYNPEAPEVAEASSRIPYLRMRRMRRNDYDRHELLSARREIERWLGYYPDLDQAPWMQGLLSKCLEKLALSDLSLARYYLQIKAPVGARLHADRALKEAQESGVTETISVIEALLAKLPPAPPEAFGVEKNEDQPEAAGTR